MKKNFFTNLLCASLCFVSCGECKSTEEKKYPERPVPVNDEQKLSQNGTTNLQTQTMINNLLPPIQNKNGNSPSCLVVGGVHYPGLLNKGNSCYLNSVMQVLYGLSSFRKDVLDAKTNDSTPSLKALQEFFLGMGNSQSAVFNPPDNFGQQLGDNGTQEDAMVFFTKLFDKISEELEANGTPNFVEKSFSFFGTRTFKCKFGHSKVFPKEVLNVMPCVVKGQNNLQDSLKNTLFKEEEMMAPNQVECSTCSTLTDGSLVYKLISLPEILICQLNRFEDVGSGIQKLNDYFEFPIELTIIDEGCDSKCPKDGREYDLFGVVVHSGFLNGGHYWVFEKLEDGRWRKFNDSEVTEVDINKDRTKKEMFGDRTSNTSGYILIYSKKGLK
jgi:ubiquitin C-terminal hydrolase